jgi:hypothetical protein
VAVGLPVAPEYEPNVSKSIVDQSPTTPGGKKTISPRRGRTTNSSMADYRKQFYQKNAVSVLANMEMGVFEYKIGENTLFAVRDVFNPNRWHSVAGRKCSCRKPSCVHMKAVDFTQSV